MGSNISCNRETISQQYSTLFQHNSREFLPHCVTVIEIRIHWYTPASKEQSMDFTQRTCSEVSEEGTIGRSGDDHCFLGFTKFDLHRLLREGQKRSHNSTMLNHWAKSMPNNKTNGPIWFRSALSLFLQTSRKRFFQTY